jgi:peroxiredoxin
MKSKSLFALIAVAGLLLAGQNCFAQAQPKSGVAKDIQAVMTKVQAKIKEARTADNGKPKKLTEADLAEEIKTLDDLMEKNKTAAPDDAAQALQLKGTLYGSFLGDREKAAKITEQLKTEFANTKLVEQMKKADERKVAMEKVADALVVGSKFPDFEEKDLEGKSLSIASKKGIVILVDFWATWCGPCRAELPNVQEAYQNHHDKGFEIISISLDREKAKLDTFIKEKNMSWNHIFDEKGKLAEKYGVRFIPMTYLIDGQGNIVAKGDEIRGKKLDAAVAKALGKS